MSRGSARNSRIAARRSAGGIAAVNLSDIPGVHRDTGGTCRTPAASSVHWRSLRSRRIPSTCHWRRRAAMALCPPPIRNSVCTAVLSLFATIHSTSSSSRKRRCFGHRSATTLTPGHTSYRGIVNSSSSESRPSSTMARMWAAIGNLHTLASGNRSSPCRLAVRPELRCRAIAPTVPSVSDAIRRHCSLTDVSAAGQRPAASKGRHCRRESSRFT